MYPRNTSFETSMSVTTVLLHPVFPIDVFSLWIIRLEEPWPLRTMAAQAGRISRALTGQQIFQWTNIRAAVVRLQQVEQVRRAITPVIHQLIEERHLVIGVLGQNVRRALTTSTVRPRATVGADFEAFANLACYPVYLDDLFLKRRGAQLVLCCRQSCCG